jgi:hypothetical protein
MMIDLLTQEERSRKISRARIRVRTGDDVVRACVPEGELSFRRHQGDRTGRRARARSHRQLPRLGFLDVLLMQVRSIS